MNFTVNGLRSRDVLPVGTIAVSAIISSTIILANTFLLVSIWRLPITRRYPNSIYLISLIAVHWCIGVFFFINMPFMYIINAPLQLLASVSNVSAYFFRLIIVVSYSLLTVMLIDRLVAVKKPFLYQRFTHKQAVILLPSAFILTAVYIILLLIDFETFSISCAFVYAFTGVLLVAGNLDIFLEVQRQLRRIKSLTCSGKQSNDYNKKLKKSVLVSLLFTLSFFVFTLPFITLVLIKFAAGNYNSYIKSDDYLKNWLWQFMLLNSVFDPLVYVSLNRPVRSALFKMMRCVSKRTNSNNNTSRIRTSEVTQSSQ